MSSEEGGHIKADSTASKVEETAQIVVHFRATGNAPILKQQKFRLQSNRKFQSLIEFLRKQLKHKSTDPLFLYVNSSFSPSPDELVSNLFKCFCVNGTLVVNYSLTTAWG